MKKLFTFFALFCSLMLAVGCGSGSGSKPSKDNMNEKIQNVFFDTPFGASRDQLISNFAKHGFDVVEDISTENWAIFSIVDTTTSHRGSKKHFSFGGRIWKHLDAQLNNGKFCSIRFLSSHNDKASALSEYEDLLSTISKKYHVSEEESSDTIVYKQHSGIDNQNRKVKTSCSRGESLAGTVLYYVILGYADINLVEAVSDEL